MQWIDKKKTSQIIMLLVILALVFSNFTISFGDEVTTSKSTSVTKGNNTIETTTVTREEGSSKEIEITKYITNNITKDVVKKRETSYENKGTGIDVYSNSMRKVVDGKQVITGNVESVFDTTTYIKNSKDTEFITEIDNETIDKLISIANVQKNRMGKDAKADITLTLKGEISEFNKFTAVITKPNLRKIIKNGNTSLKVKTPFAYIKLDKVTIEKLLKDASNSLVITLTKVEKEDKKGVRITVNNGKQIVKIAPQTAEIGLAYEGSFGLAPERIELSTIGDNYKEKKITEGITYSDNTHMIAVLSDTLGKYTVHIKPVIFEDVEKHWAKKAIDKWSDCGVITGYNGKFNPNNNITRGDMSIILDKIMCYQKNAENNFTDLKGNEYYADAILKAEAAKIINSEEKVVRPKDFATREEVTVMIAKAFGTAPESKCSVSFNDKNMMAEWTEGYINALVNKGCLSGYNGDFNPKNPITRAETVTILSNMATELVNFGEYSKDVQGNLLVNGKNTKLKDMNISGNLIISEGVGDGDVILENVKVNGNTIVRGGGENSIHVNGESILNNVDIQKQTGNVRLVIDKSAKANTVTINEKSDGAVLEGNMIKVQVNSIAPVKLQKLTAEKVSVNIPKAKLKVDSMSHIETVEVVKDAEKTALDISGEVKNINAAAEGIKVEGTGSVDKVEITGNNVTVKTNGTDVKVGENVKGAIAGKESIEAGKCGKTPGHKPSVSSSGKVEVSVSPYAPSIETSLVDGKTYKGGKLTFDLFAKDPKKNKISGKDCKVTLNGLPVKINWDDNLKTSYTLNLESGKNEVVVEATAEGETTKKTYDIKYVSGTMYATISLDAEVLGEGYLIPPMKVAVNDGENAAYVLDRYLSENGFKYKNTGSLDSAFYLSAITGGEVTNIPITTNNIPKNIKELLKAYNYDLSNREDKLSLGEFDYTRGSGWMYCVNDVYPNVGFADYFLQDGDVLKIRYTLSLGNDIGGGYCLGGK